MRRFFYVGTCPTRALVFTFFGFISKFNRHFSLSVVNNLKTRAENHMGIQPNSPNHQMKGLMVSQEQMYEALSLVKPSLENF
jgi:hypothetical protein